MMLDQEMGDRGQIVSNDAPADPTFHAYFAMSQAAVQMPCASQLADAAFDPIAEPLSGAKPGLPFVVAATVGLITWLWQADMIHPQSLRLLLVVGRVNAAIAAHFLRRFTKHLAVIAEAGEQKLGFIRVALQKGVFADQTALNFGIPNLATKLRVFRFGFAATDEGGMGFKEAQHLIAGGRRLPVQDSRLGLGDDLLHQGHILIKT